MSNIKATRSYVKQMHSRIKECEEYITWSNARISKLEALLREAGEALEPIAKKDGVLDFVEIADLRRAAEVLKKIRALGGETA